MILSAILWLVGSVLFIANLLFEPFTLATDTFSNMIEVWDIAVGFNRIFPLLECMQFLSLVIAFEFTYWLAKVIISFMSLVRGGGHIDI